MTDLDRTMLVALAAALAWCAWAFTHVAGYVADAERRQTPVTIVRQPEPTVGERH